MSDGPGPRRLPPEPGTYVLILRPQRAGTLRVGKLGSLELGDAWYAYVGSAFGPGGLGARVGRHVEGGRTRHWHVDYLAAAARVVEVWYTRDPERREEAWADALRAWPAAENPLSGFGAGDCGCAGHLFRFGDRPELYRFRRRLGAERGAGPECVDGSGEAEGPGYELLRLRPG